MDTAQWPQEVGVVKPMAETASSSGYSKPMMVERQVRPGKEQALNCPRCNSTNTKFCYYNNYSLTQPRYFCKTCRRYWTQGGSLRNVPVGGGSRKSKRSSSSSAPSLKPLDLNPLPLSPAVSSQNRKTHQAKDLNLAQNFELPMVHNSSSSSPLSALELFKSGFNCRGLSSFVPPLVQNSSMVYNSGLALNLQDVKPNNLSFPVDGLGNRFGNVHGVEEMSSGRLLFPFGAVKQLSSGGDQDDQNKGHGNSAAGYWNGMLGGGLW